MEHKTLDALLDASAPRMSESEATDVLVLQLVDHTVRPRRRSRRSRLTIAAFAVAGTLALGTGAAIAAPFLADWWMWIPDEDLTIQSEPFERGGMMITCETTIRVVLDGATATDTSTSRLQAARDFLGRVDPDDYEADAVRMAREANEGMWSNLSPQLAHDATLAMAIMLDMHAKGLTGEGVALDSGPECPEAE